MRELILTEGARRAIQRAVHLAENLNSPVVTPTHLLCSLLDEESPAQELLEKLCVDRTAIHQVEFYSEPQPGAPMTPSLNGRVEEEAQKSGEISHEARPRESLELESSIVFAQRTAAREGEFVEVSSLHLLAGLAGIDSPVAELLKQHGVNDESIGLRGRRQREESLAEPMAVDFEIDCAGEQPVDTPRTPAVCERPGSGDVWRILDAAANRAREGLRVVEDFVRFTRDDAHLATKLKELRHHLSTVIGCLDADSLIQSRDTPQDVGTTISTPQEMARAAASDVAKAGLKRAQEATRTLEEFSKVIAPSGEAGQSSSLSEQFAQIRYGIYTLEKAILTAITSSEQLEGRDLYLLLTVESCQLDWVTVLRESIAGGVSVVQVREKSMADAELLAHARQVREITRETGTLLIMNDRPDLAVLAECDGVHVGQEELSVRDIRRIAGPDLLIGISTHSIEQAHQAVLDGAGYIGVGPVFPTATKQFEEFTGLSFVHQMAGEISLPAFPIGGIDTKNLTEVLAAGAKRVAVSGAICRSEAPRQAAAALCQKLASH